MYGTGNNNRSFRLALSCLGGFYLAFASFSAIGQVDPSQQVNTTRNPTTGYYETGPRTFNTPPGVTVSSSRDITPNVIKTAAGGASQSIPSGITIDALKTSAPISAQMRATASVLKNAVSRCFVSIPCNIALVAGSIGIQELLDRYDWSFDGSDLVGSEPILPSDPAFSPWRVTQNPGAGYFPTPAQACQASVGFGALYQSYVSYRMVNNNAGHCLYNTQYGTQFEANLGARSGFNGNCPSGFAYNSQTGICSSGSASVPLSQSEIDAAVETYEFHPSDWRYINAGLDLSLPGVDIEITSLPRLETPPQTFTRYDVDGNPVEITETNIWDDFSPRPGTNPSKQPTIDRTTTESTTTYDGTGNQTGSSETVVTSPGGSIPPGNTTEPPIDCEFMPTVCRFLDWFQEPDSLPEPDFEGLIIPFEDNSAPPTVGPSNGTCPAPFMIELTWIPSVQVSYQPFCDLAQLMRSWLLAIAYFSAAYITVRSV